MGKATFIQKWYGRGYDRHMVYLEYEYRGRQYTVYENRAKGNEPLSWQHKNAQAQIDSAIEIESKRKPYGQGNPPDWDEIFKELGWDDLVKEG